MQGHHYPDAPENFQVLYGQLPDQTLVDHQGKHQDPGQHRTPPYQCYRRQFYDVTENARKSKQENSSVNKEVGPSDWLHLFFKKFDGHLFSFPNQAKKDGLKFCKSMQISIFVPS
jgi:hypothetical protein